MTVKYTLVARGDPREPAAPQKYYPVARSTGRVRQRDLAEQAAAMSTLSSADLAAALEAFVTLIPRELIHGNIVDLGDLGTFSLRIRGEGAETEEAFSANNIIQVMVAFRPGPQFKRILDEAQFEKA